MTCLLRLSVDHFTVPFDPQHLIYTLFLTFEIKVFAPAFVPHLELDSVAVRGQHHAGVKRGFRQITEVHPFFSPTGVPSGDNGWKPTSRLGKAPVVSITIQFFPSSLVSWRARTKAELSPPVSSSLNFLNSASALICSWRSRYQAAPPAAEMIKTTTENAAIHSRNTNLSVGGGGLSATAAPMTTNTQGPLCRTMARNISTPHILTWPLPRNQRIPEGAAVYPAKGGSARFLGKRRNSGHEGLAKKGRRRCALGGIAPIFADWSARKALARLLRFWIILAQRCKPREARLP